MGTRGPAPKRSTERRRRNKASKSETVAAEGAVKVPECPRGFHPRARAWYLSLRRSAQSQYYEPSDWQDALLVAQQMSELLKEPGPIPASAFQALWTAMGNLMSREVDRRRVRVEVERKSSNESAPPPGITMLAELRKKVGA